MFQPLSYQRTCLAKLAKARPTKKALVVMATGLGKTVTVAMDVKSWLRSNPSGRVLYVCHQTDILRQARATFEGVIGGNSSCYGYYHGYTKHANAQFLFASFQAMRGHLRSFKRDDFGYIVVDESHHTHAETYRPLVKYFRPNFLLGLTATPDRSDLQDIREVFGEEVFSLNLPEALAHGYLTSVDYRLVTDEIVDLGKIENPYRLTVKELNKRIFIPKRDEEISRIIHEKIQSIKHPRVIVFCSSIAHAEQFHASMPGSIPIHSGIAKGEQVSRLDAFRRGLVTTAITVDKFNEGIDVPEVNVVVFLRSTQSYTVFYQQLGRGLRRLDGKEKVLVLDFVASCERIRMVHELSTRSKEARKVVARSISKSGTSASKVVTDFGGFEFTDKARDILAILRMVEGGYTREALIGQMQSLARKLGSSPTSKDVMAESAKGKMAGADKFREEFGSWSDALRAAGLTPNHVRGSLSLTLVSLTQWLQERAKELGRSPTAYDMAKRYKLEKDIHPRVIKKKFGSWNKGLLAAKLRVTRMTSYTKKSLLGALRAEAKKLKRSPIRMDIAISSREGRTPSPSLYEKIFGSFGNALEKAGLKANRQRYTKKDLVNQILLGKKALGRIPVTSKDVDMLNGRGIMASRGTFTNHFKTWPNALRAAGLLK